MNFSTGADPLRLSIERRQEFEKAEAEQRKAALDLVKDCKDSSQRAQVLAQHCKLLHVLKPNHQVKVLLTIIRNRNTGREDFMFQSNRIMRMLMSVARVHSYSLFLHDDDFSH